MAQVVPFQRSQESFYCKNSDLNSCASPSLAALGTGSYIVYCELSSHKNVDSSFFIFDVISALCQKDELTYKEGIGWTHVLIKPSCEISK